MPININDEALDALDAAPEPERLKFFQSLAPEDRDAIAAAVPAWRQRKAQPVPASAPETDYGPPPQAFNPEDPQLQPSPSFDVNAQQPMSPQPQMPVQHPAMAARMPGAQFEGVGDLYAHPLDALNSAKEHIISPVVQAAQKYVGRPFSEAMLGVAGFDSSAPLPDGSTLAGTGDDLLARRLLSVPAGSTFAEETMSEKEQLQAVNALESAYGSTGAAYIQGITEQIGGIPLLVAGSAPKVNEAVSLATAAKFGPKFAEAYPVLAKTLTAMAGGAAEGITMGTAQAAFTPGQTLQEGALVGTTMGAAVPGALGLGEKGVQLGSKTVEMIRPHAVATYTALQGIADDVERFVFDFYKGKLEPVPAQETAIRGVISGPPRPELANPYGTSKVHKREVPPVGEVQKLGDINPSFVAVSMDETGQFYSTYTEIRPDEGSLRWYREPLNTSKDAATTVANAQSQGIRVQLSTTARDHAHRLPSGAIDILDSQTVRGPKMDLMDTSPNAERFEPRAGNRGSDKNGIVLDKTTEITVPEGPRKPFKNRSENRGAPSLTFGGGAPTSEHTAVASFEWDPVTKHVKVVEVKNRRPDLSVADPLDFERFKSPDDAPVVQSQSPSALVTHEGTLKVVPMETPKDGPMSSDDMKIEILRLMKENETLAKKADAGNESAGAGPYKPTSEVSEGGKLIRLPKKVKPPTLAEAPELPLELEGKGIYVQLPVPITFNAHDTRNYAAGKVIGRDPKNPDNVLVRLFDQPKFAQPVSYKRSDVFLEAPPGVSTIEHLVQPPPVPPPQPGQLTSQQIGAANTVAKLVRYVQQKVGANKDSVLAKVLPNHLRWTDDINAWVLQGQAARSSARPEEIQAAILSKLTAKDGGVFTTIGVSDSMEQLALGHITFTDFAAKHPQAAQRMNGLLDDLIGELRERSFNIETLGGIREGSTASRDDGDLQQYLATIYRAHYLGPGKWAKIVPNEVLENAAQFFMEQMEKSPDKFLWNKQMVVAEIERVLNDTDPLTRLKNSGMSAPFKHLLEKSTTVPEPIQKLLGQENSGVLKVAMSIANQRVIENQLTFWNDIVNFRTEDGVNPYFSPGPRVDLHMDPLPMDARNFGKAAGGYVHPAFAEMVKTANLHTAGLGFQRAIGGWIKRNQVVYGGMKPWTNNFIRNLKPAMLAGGLDPFAPLDTGRAYFDGLKALLSWKETPTPFGDDLRALVWEARRAGALPGGFGHSEVKSGQQDRLFRELKKEMAKWSPKDDIFTMMDKIRMFGDKITKTMDMPVEWYDLLGDQFWKMGTYIHLRKKYLAQGMGLDEAVKAASLTINKRFANFEHVAPIVEKVRSSTFGSVAPYFSGIAEDVRTNIQTALDLRNDSELRKNMAKMLMVIGAASATTYAARRLNGVSDEEVDAAVAERTKRSQVYRPLMIAMPERDSEGRVQFFDASQWVPESLYLVGHPDDTAAAKIASNLMLMSHGDSPVGAGIRAVQEKAGLVRPVPGGALPMREGEQGALNVMQMFFQSGMLPTGPYRLAEAIRKGQPAGSEGQSRFADPQTAGQVAGNIAGLPLAGGVTVAGVTQNPQTGQVAQMSPTRVQSLVEYKATVEDLKKQLASVMASTMDPQKKDEMKKAILDRIIELSKQNQQVNQKIKTAQDYVRK
jgi:hypothetical protein